LEKALALSKEVGISEDLQPRVLDSIAEIYLNDGQLDKANETSLECLKLCEEFSQKATKGYALFRIGYVFMKQNRLNEAKEYFLQSLDLRKEIDDKFGEAHDLLHLGKLHPIQIQSRLEYLLNHDSS
jgi:tetratricopeptide (TPR) repeat protein